ncbi:MAG: LysM peptidoglycan-binding domain-containing protein [Phycisphaerales bacterium]|nr:MAG: LysM peptidoglycan-binding domain-containing protein [Phycisphaerales bacterium]
MRRNALCLCVSLLVVVTIVGCHKPDATAYHPQTSEVIGDPYTPPIYSAPTQEYDAYAEDTQTPGAEPSYRTMTEPPAVETQTRYHTVAKKDTLFKLARAYYSDASRWKDIYNANRSQIEDPNKIFVGQQLLIP